MMRKCGSASRDRDEVWTGCCPRTIDRAGGLDNRLFVIALPYRDPRSQHRLRDRLVVVERLSIDHVERLSRHAEAALPEVTSRKRQQGPPVDSGLLESIG